MKITEKQQHSKAFLNQRKAMLVMPLLVVPFLTFGFWALGGGGSNVKKEKADVLEGINTSIPSAENDNDAGLDKLAFYKKAEKDSLERMKRIKDDPYYQSTTMPQNLPVNQQQPPLGMQPYAGFPAPATGAYNGYGYNDPNERRVNEKIAELNAALNAKAAPQLPSGYPPQNNPGTSPSVTSGDIDRLEKMMGNMQSNTLENDPEMQQIHDVLGQILDIQHPERVSERLKQSSEKNNGMVYPVTAVNNVDPISILEGKKGADSGKSKANAFYSFSEQNAAVEQNTISAVMYQTQSLVNGSIVKLRLTNDIYVNGQLIPSGSFVFGKAQINGERVMIAINSLRYSNSLFPVKLVVYDIDGLDGIYIPGAISRDVAKESSDRAIQSLGMTSLDPSISAQALGMGVEAAKSLLSKKVKLVKVTVKAGYQVLLKDDNQKNLN